MFYIDPDLLAAYRKKVDLSNFPKQFVRAFENATAQEKDEWFEGRFLCLKYHRYLAGYVESTKPNDPLLPVEYEPIMGMDFQEDPHDLLFAQFLQKRPGENAVFTDLDPRTKKRMILWPRGLFKTSAGIVDMVQTILNYPDIRMLFLTGGDQLAKRQLGRVKRVFERPTKRFKHLFPEYCMRSIRNKRIKIPEDQDPETYAPAWMDVPAKLGTAKEFTVPCRIKDTYAEPTFAISTAKSVKAGSHFDIIYIDDLVNEQNYRSVKALEKCYQDYLDICPLLDPVGFMIVTGTRYSFGDTYERIQENARDEERKLGRTIWSFSIRDCWSHGCSHCSHTSVYHDYNVNITQPPCAVPGCHCIGFQDNGVKGVLFPEARTVEKKSIGHSLEFLEGEKVRLGDEFFANQYENRPIATGAQTFTETMIGGQTLHKLTDIPDYASSFNFVVGDLAYVGEEGRDFSVLFMCRMFRGQLFIYDCLFGNWNSTQVAENTIKALLIAKPSIMYYEKFNGWDAYNNLIAAKAKDLGIIKVPIQWEKGDQAPKAKLARIGSVQGVLTSRRLWFYGGMPGYQILVNQLVKWPKLGRHDDFADCAGMVVKAPTGYQLENPPQVVSTTNWLRTLHQNDTTDDSYYDSGLGTGMCG